VIGVVLIRHLHLTIGIIGIVWIVQGLVSLIAGLSGGSREGRGWWIFFGIVSLIAGIVVAAAPVSSVTVLAGGPAERTCWRGRSLRFTHSG